MEDTPVIQLVTLWFVVLIYIQTGSGGSGAVNMILGAVAILLVYILPLTLIIFTVLRLVDN
ncbi:hypothetical protein SAMN05192552_10934 [Natrinema hispanicum]|uniref:Uncharacterized protein n=1 Tax=Natrinema hispanicum TaxID=392421 RepID=A0A1I0IXF7_9EURY|nr:hypothetical protein BDK88_4298 [Natrinema hispanicum]SDD99386.1 hypothetical protein SAMN05192552_10934 [Natrinema hispanicum]SEU01830.1 hypothetical protein SAMN04488694_1279 [Natrinema hispanicum]